MLFTCTLWLPVLLCLLSLSAVVSVLVSLLVCFPVRRPSHGFLSPLPPSPPCRCAVSVCHSTCLRLVSLFALLSHFVSTFSGLVWLSLPSCIPSSLRLTICLLCLSSCQEPSETWLSAWNNRIPVPGGPFKNLPGFGPSSSEEPCFTISIQTTWGKFEVRVMVFSTWHGARTISGGSGVSIAGITSVADVAGIMRLWADHSSNSCGVSKFEVFLSSMCQTIGPQPQCLKFEVSSFYTVLILHGPKFGWAPPDFGWVIIWWTWGFTWSDVPEEVVEPLPEKSQSQLLGTW